MQIAGHQNEKMRRVVEHAFLLQSFQTRMKPLVAFDECDVLGTPAGGYRKSRSQKTDDGGPASYWIKLASFEKAGLLFALSWDLRSTRPQLGSNPSSGTLEQNSTPRQNHVFVSDERRSCPYDVGLCHFQNGRAPLCRSRNPGDGDA